MTPPAIPMARIADPLENDEDVDAKRKGERQQRQIGKNRNEPVQFLAVLAALDDPVIWPGRDQQGDRAYHQDQAEPVEMAGMHRQVLIGLAEGATQLETEQDLHPEDQHPRLVERGLDLL